MSELVPMYKGKGDVLECSSSRGIKILEHGMKVVERVLEKRLRQAVEIIWFYVTHSPFSRG